MIEFRWILAELTWVEIATVPVAVALVAVAIAMTTGLITGASSVTGDTDVRSHGVGNPVGLPDVHLVAASTFRVLDTYSAIVHSQLTSVAGSSVLVVVRTTPTFNVGLAFDELYVSCALAAEAGQLCPLLSKKMFQVLTHRSIRYQT